MKKVIYAIYEGLINWAMIIAEYRQSKVNKYYY
jgi:hypothetical protein